MVLLIEVPCVVVYFFRDIRWFTLRSRIIYFLSRQESHFRSLAKCGQATQNLHHNLVSDLSAFQELFFEVALVSWGLFGQEQAKAGPCIPIHLVSLVNRYRSCSRAFHNYGLLQSFLKLQCVTTPPEFQDLLYLESALTSQGPRLALRRKPFLAFLLLSEGYSFK